MTNKNEMSPEDKLMKAVFGKKYKTEAEIEAEIESLEKETPEMDVNVNHEDFLLFIHAMKRLDELKPMVERLSARVYFPNENYKKVFQHSLMMAAQWQWEQMMQNAIEGLVVCDKELTHGLKDIVMEIPDNLQVNDKVKLIIMKRD